MNKYIFLVNIILYVIILFAIYLIFKDSISQNAWLFFRSNSKKRKSSFFHEYLKRVFLSLSNVYNESQIETLICKFYIISLVIFLALFSVILKYNLYSYRLYYAFSISFVPAIIASCIPFMFLMLKLYNTRMKGSYEGPLVVNEIYDQYRIYNFNIAEAIDAAIKNLDDSVICKRYLLRLSMRIKDYQTDKELLEILDEFSFSINTNWIRMLSDSIFFALENKMNIELSLSGIIDQFSSVDETHNMSSRLNNEGFIMGKILAPTLYVVMIIVSVKLFKISLNDYFYCQFTGQGLKYLIFIVILFLAIYVIEYFYKRRKFDF